jgi:hypothetical protein
MRGTTYVAVATAANFVVITMDHVGCVRLLCKNIAIFSNMHSDFCTAISLAGCMISLSLDSATKAHLLGPTSHTGNALGHILLHLLLCLQN